MGFEKGNVLEPAMGIGNFFGMLPEKMQELAQASQKLMEIAQQQHAQQQAGADASANNAKDDDVVDAVFEEVKDKK